MAFMAKQRAQAHYNAGSQILVNLNPSSSPKKDYIRAINHLQKVVELDPDSAYGFHNLAHAWYKIAEHEHLVTSAHRQFRHMQDVENSIMDAIDKGDNDMVEKIREQYAKESMGDGLITGYFVLALQAVDRVLEIQYDFPQAHNTRAMILAKLGRLDEAIEATEVALSQAPNYKNASDNREKMKELKKQV
jgi:tetratricopeptide (TPR) repeat protein